MLQYFLAERLQKDTFCEADFMQSSVANFANFQNMYFM